MHILGLTGGSGTGKTTISDTFAALGAGVVDADAIYRGLCTHCTPMLSALQNAFGAILLPDGSLDRPALAAIVFADPAKLRQLSMLTMPYIDAAARYAFKMLAANGCALALYDAPTLFETGADAFCDAVLGVLSAKETRVQRIIQRDGLTEAAARARIGAQPDDDFYRNQCTYLLENNDDLSSLQAKIAALYKKLTQGGT